MQRCHIDPAQWNPSSMALPPAEQHHLLHVLRLPEGTVIMAFDGQGREAETRLVPPDSTGQAHLEVVRIFAQIEKTIDYQWILVPAIIKGSRMDSLMEKCTELGARRIIPIQTERSVVRLDPQQARQKVMRWERIAISAAKQCGTPHLPAIEPVTDLAAALRQLQAEHVPILLGSLTGTRQPIARITRKLLGQSQRTIAILTGPEGDFSPKEYEQAAAAGCIPVSLGNLVLRAETAAIFALSTLQALRDEASPDIPA